MMDFFAEKFEGICKFCAILNFIFFTVAGVICGIALENIFYSFLFAIIGFLLAMLYNILLFGLLAQFISMRNYLERITNVVEKNGSVLSGEEKPYQYFSSPSSQQFTVNSDGTWTCKKCGDVNPANASSCKGCGTYK